MIGCKDGNEDGVPVGSHVSPSIEGVVVFGGSDGLLVGSQVSPSIVGVFVFG